MPAFASMPTTSAADAPSAADSIYRRLAPYYDVVYGAGLQPGRRLAQSRLSARRGELILEAGVGTGLSALAYPPGCRVVAIDLSAPMLGRAQSRLACRGMSNVSLAQMDAGQLAFGDHQFDAVFAAYLINVVPDPVAVTRELLRVLRPGGRLVLLNHFSRVPGTHRVPERVLGFVARRFGVNWHIDLGTYLRDTGLVAQSVEATNIPRVSAVVVCRKP